MANSHAARSARKRIREHAIYIAYTQRLVAERLKCRAFVLQ
jgi:hypothetical protein